MHRMCCWKAVLCCGLQARNFLERARRGDMTRPHFRIRRSDECCTQRAVRRGQARAGAMADAAALQLEALAATAPRDLANPLGLRQLYTSIADAGADAAVSQT